MGSPLLYDIKFNSEIKLRKLHLTPFYEHEHGGSK